MLRVDTGRPILLCEARPGRQAGDHVPGARLRSRFALVNDGPGIVSTIEGRLSAVLAFTVADGLIVEIDILADPRRLATLDTRRDQERGLVRLCARSREGGERGPRPSGP